MSRKDPAIHLTDVAIDLQAGELLYFANQRETPVGAPINDTSLLTGPNVRTATEIVLTSEPTRDNLISLKDRRK